MAMGMEMLFAQMGIDVKGIQKLINPETVQQTLDGLQRLMKSQNEIQQSLLRIETKLNTLPYDEAMKLLEANSHLDTNPVRVETEET